jgi:hypothetical protein
MPLDRPSPSSNRAPTSRHGAARSSPTTTEPAELEVPDELRPWLRIAAAEVVVEGIGFLIASLHPHYDAVDPPLQGDQRLRGYMLDGARWLWHCDVAFGILQDKLEASSRFIVSGDWNTARAFQSSSVPDARFSEAFSTAPGTNTPSPDALIAGTA